MHVVVVTLFPEMIRDICSYGVLSRGIKQGLLRVSCENPRDYTEDKHRTVDDRPFGGGPGMLMKVEPLRDAIAAARRSCEGGRVIALTPQGAPLCQDKVKSLAGSGNLVLVAGRYEGIDERVLESDIDEEISIGDYVLSGGELAAMVIIDALCRWIPGVLGDDDSAANESFADGLLDHPHYTRPQWVGGRAVPSVLLSGNHEQIRRWRLQQAVVRTYERRPDLWARRVAQNRVSEEERRLLDEFLAGAAKDVNS